MGFISILSHFSCSLGALGLEAKNEAGKLQQNGGTNTTANLSNPITNADKEKKESESSTPANANPSTPDVDTSMPGGFAGGIASAGTGGGWIVSA